MIIFIAQIFIKFSLNLQLPVDVYYESLCPDSMKFINQQLYPVKTSSLGRYFDVNLIPFGKASVSTHQLGILDFDNLRLNIYFQWVTNGADVNFTCQHGPNECYGNKIQACALHHIQVCTFSITALFKSLLTHTDNCFSGKFIPKYAHT